MKDSPFAAAQAGARFAEWRGWRRAEEYTTSAEEYAAARTACAVIDRPDLATLSVAGKDAADLLQRIVTVSVRDLEPGSARAGALVSPIGRLISTFHLLAVPEGFHLVYPEPAAEQLQAALQQYVIADDVVVRDTTDEWCAVECIGPLRNNLSMRLEAPFDAKHPFSTGTLSLCRRPDAEQVWSRLVASAGLIGGRPIGYNAFEMIRIEEGRPEFGIDIGHTTIPLEANLDYAVDFEKGCFPGQEVLARMRNLGRPARKMVGVTAESELQPGPLWDESGKEAGVITSCTTSPALGRAIALAMVRWEYRTPGTRLQAAGISVEVAQLPFVQTRR